MSDACTLLVELGSEELPPKALDELAEAFARGICAGLDANGIVGDIAAATVFSTPRRLAVRIRNVASMQPEQSIERRGPSVEAGLDAAGKPSKALLGFARSCGVEVDELQQMHTDKGAWFVYRAEQAGRSLADLFPALLADAVKALPIPRPMRWGDHEYSFVRPLHWLVALHGDNVLEAELMGVRSGRETHGHRFHHPAPVSVEGAESWVQALHDAHVEVEPARRETVIRDQCRNIAIKQDLDLTPMYTPELLRELVNITEWPVPILCRFDDDFLALPAPVLTTTMEVDQRFIATTAPGAGTGEGGAHTLSPWFFGIANIDSKDPEQIRQGYERVIRPRFADAEFFFEEDLKAPLAEHQEQLKRVTYQENLGSLWDKSTRVAELARVIANRVGVDAALATQAAALSKCDLMTRMVGEFPELQGVMGYYYARKQGTDIDVALALDQFYRPRHAGERIADSPLAQVLAVAERLDTLAGIFAVGLKPSGNRDPFALRRAALGLARTLIEGQLDIDLHAHFIEALEQLPDSAFVVTGKPREASVPSRTELADALYGFVVERLRGYYVEQDFATGLFEAVAAVEPHSLLDFDRRLRALAQFAERPESARLAAANKRVANILRKQADTDISSTAQNAPAASEPAEIALAAALAQATQAATADVEAANYAAALGSLAALDEPLEQFFSDVMVNDNDAGARARKLALLQRIHAQFMTIADIGRLQEL